MHSSSFYTSKGFSYGQSFPTQNFNRHSNQYYCSKMYDDHRFERRKLEKPGFLIKQQKIYPQSSHYSIGSALDYADNLVKPPNNRFYCQGSQEQRIRVQGINPFASNDRYFSDLGQNSYMKKSSRSRMDTNPNLGVTSYQILQQSRNPESYSKNQLQSHKKSSRFKKQDMQDYISQSLLQNYGKKMQSSMVKNHIIREEEQESAEDMFYQLQKRQTFNPEVNAKWKSGPTIVKLKQNPEQLIYKGKKYVKLGV